MNEKSMYAFPLKMANSEVRFQLFKNGFFRAGGQNFLHFLKGLSKAYKFVIIQHPCISTSSGRKTASKWGGRKQGLNKSIFGHFRVVFLIEASGTSPGAYT